MSTDGLTKVLEGSDFDFFFDQALGTNKSTGGRWGYGARISHNATETWGFTGEVRFRILKRRYQM